MGSSTTAARARSWRRRRVRCAGPPRRKSPPSGNGWRRRKRSAANASPRTKPTRRSPRSTTYEPEQEVAAGMGFLPGGERPPQVQQGLQGLCPSMQAEFSGGGGVLPALSFPPFQKVQELGLKMGEETAYGGFSV